MIFINTNIITFSGRNYLDDICYYNNSVCNYVFESNDLL